MNVPKLRFKEFSGEWEEKTLGEVTRIIVSGKNNNRTVEGEFPVFGSIGRIGSTNDVEFDGESLLVARVGANAGLLNYINEKCGVSDNTLVVKFKNEYNTKFFYNALQKYNLNKLSFGSGQPLVTGGMLKKLKIIVPNADEQNKIVKFFDLVDEKIENQKAIVEYLEKQKKGLMQKIFSQELRFKDDEGKDFPAWEEKLIKEVCSISTGKSNTQDKVDDGIYPFYVRSSVVERSNKYLYDEEAVLTVGDGVGTGKIYHYVNGKYDLHQRVYRMYDFVGISAKYFYFYFSSHFYDRVSKMSAKNSVDSVRLNMIADMRISVPCMEEQSKIVEVLTSLERRLNISKEVLECWQQVKKGLLQQMFV